MKEKAFRELHMELCWNIVKGGKKMDYINAFWVGGLICALAQILLDRTKMMPGRVMVSLVVLGCILGFVQIFKPLQEYAGAGVSVPLLGFGNTLWNGVKEAVDKEGFIGIFLGGLFAFAVLFTHIEGFNMFGIGLAPVWDWYTVGEISMLTFLFAGISVTLPSIKINSMNITDLLGRE